MDIKVLGTGCSRCASLEKTTRQAVEKAGINAQITKIEDIMDIISFGVMTTPALIVNGKVLVKGRVPSVDELVKILHSTEG